MIAIALTVALAALTIGLGLLRWRLATLYWQTHEGVSAGYRRDCVLLVLPMLFFALGAGICVDLLPEFGPAVFLFVAPLALTGAVAVSLLPPWRKASVRIMRAHYPLEAPNGH